MNLTFDLPADISIIKREDFEDYQVVNMVDSSFDLEQPGWYDDSLLGDKLEKELRLAVDEFRHNQENALLQNS